ncbi:MAG: hypothetical protein EON54_06095 [Alcaligenaceae bacterium]|nr:MAG: hypothetical protein EON54_06095 [Alcaligenaceae bacterium]
MKFDNTTPCPYLAMPLKHCSNVNQEHILASALGTPDGLVIRCDESQNQRLNLELDVPTLRMELLQLLAVSSGVVSRSGKDSVTLTGSLPNGDAAKVTLSPCGARFAVAAPVEVNRKSGHVSAVKGFGPEALERAKQVVARYQASSSQD